MFADIWKILTFIVLLTVVAGIAMGTPILTIIIFLITVGAALWWTHRQTRNWQFQQPPEDDIPEEPVKKFRNE